MKISSLVISICAGLSSCQQSTKELGPVGDPSRIAGSLMNWLVYQRDNIYWRASYYPLNNAGQLVTKEQFLQSLESGKYFPVKIRQSDSSLCYKLYKFDQMADDNVASVIKDKAELELKYLSMEGKPLPFYDFVDVAGRNFDSATRSGKMLIINCWFINCQPCVAEIPALNKLVDAFKTRKDILFLALTFDSRDSLRSFLAKTRFNYNVLPVSEAYLAKQLGIVYYPTQIVVGKDGKIQTVTNEFDDILIVLNE